MHLLHESCAIRPEEAFSKRAGLNHYLLEEYNQLILNIEESGLPWNAEQRKYNVEKLLNLDVCYLESHLKPGKSTEWKISQLRTSLKAKSQSKLRGELQDELRGELQDKSQDESREFWWLESPKEAKTRRRQRLVNFLYQAIDKTQDQLDNKLVNVAPEEVQWGDNLTKEYDRVYRNTGKNSPRWSKKQLRGCNNEFITLEAKYRKKLLCLKYAKGTSKQLPIHREGGHNNPVSNVKNSTQ